MKSLSRVRLFVIPWTVAYQASLSMEFSRQEYWSGLPFPSPHSVVFEIASKYCILDSFVDHDGYSLSSEGFLPTVIDIMVI